MFEILDMINTYDDTWRMTFYFVAAVAILIGLFWTILQSEKQKKNDLNENTIYNKSYDAIERDDILLHKKRISKDKDEIQNYYDVYQSENKRKRIKEKEIDG